MNKMIAAVIALGLASGLYAGTVKCEFPVYKTEPIWKTVIKKIPKKECWEEEQKSAINYTNSGADACSTSGIVVSKRCVVTKCRTVYESYEEKILVGYKNYAKCGVGCGEITKISNCKLETITGTVSF